MIDMSKMRAAVFFKGIAPDQQIKQWILEAYATRFYSLEEAACLLHMLDLEAV